MPTFVGDVVGSFDQLAIVTGGRNLRAIGRQVDMAKPYIELYVHIVWATWDRHPLIDPDVLPRLHAAIAEKCRELGCPPIAIGGTVDHAHGIVKLKPSLPLSQLVQETKGYSSYPMNRVFAPDVPFKWQGSYGAIAVPLEAVERVARYVRNQAQHHADGSLIAEFERTVADDREPGGR